MTNDNHFKLLYLDLENYFKFGHSTERLDMFEHESFYPEVYRRNAVQGLTIITFIFNCFVFSLCFTLSFTVCMCVCVCECMPHSFFERTYVIVQLSACAAINEITNTSK